jgi:hypothetical protein
MDPTTQRQTATKVVVSVILTESNQPDSLKHWSSEVDLDVRHDPAISEEILTFLRPYAPRSTVIRAFFVRAADNPVARYVFTVPGGGEKFLLTSPSNTDFPTAPTPAGSQLFGKRFEQSL